MKVHLHVPHLPSFQMRHDELVLSYNQEAKTPLGLIGFNTLNNNLGHLEYPASLIEVLVPFASSLISKSS